MASPHSVGLAVAAVREKEGPLGGVVHLHALRHVSPISGMTLDEWRMALQTDVKSLFYFTQAAAADLRSSQSGCRLLAAVPAVAGLAGGGGIAGLVNAIATEWPGIGGRTVAVDLSKSAADTAAALAREMACNTRERFISLNGDRKRIRIEPAELNMSGPKQMRIKPDWVILLTGGACGITAQVAMEIAERFKSTIVLLGRSPEPEADEPPETRGVERPEALRRIMSAELSRLRGSASIAEVESAYRGLLRSREIRATISSLRAAGSRAVYMQADVRNELSVSAVIERVYAEFGRLDGVVFGAGIVEDKRIEDKTPESFDRVFDTKADGTFILTGRLRLDSLKFAAFFSSTAYLGNAGQSDYAAANGTMNALARDLDGRMRGRSVALLWGPWGMSGMTTQETRGRFREMGVQIIPPAAGRRRFVEELEYGLKGDVEVIIGSAPYFADESAS
jgi:NAD(P)-dependent dehydrogenase (short-subunit alcohol dehydrogenase family)